MVIPEIRLKLSPCQTGENYKTSVGFSMVSFLIRKEEQWKKFFTLTPLNVNITKEE
jgi:hypothetical protein